MFVGFLNVLFASGHVAKRCKGLCGLYGGRLGEEGTDDTEAWKSHQQKLVVHLHASKIPSSIDQRIASGLGAGSEAHS